MSSGTRRKQIARGKARGRAGDADPPCPLASETEARPNNRPAFLASRRPLVAPALPPLAPTSPLSLRSAGGKSGRLQRSERHRRLRLAMERSLDSSYSASIKDVTYRFGASTIPARFLLPRSPLNFLALGQRTWNPSLFLTLTRIHNYFSLRLRCNPFSSLPFEFAVQFSTEELY